jgi:LysM repeat protein
MAIGDPKTDKSSRRKGRRRTNKSGTSKNYSPNFLEMTVAFLNKTPKEAGLFDAHPKSAKGRAAAKKKEAKKNLDRDIVKAREKRDINLIVNRAEKAAKKKADPLKGLDLSKSTKAYRIKKGDTLSAIAARNDTTVAELKKLNNIKDVNKIVAGKSLKLPSRSMRMPKPKPKGKK